MPKLTKKSYLSVTDGRTDPNYRKALLLTDECDIIPGERNNSWYIEEHCTNNSIFLQNYTTHNSIAV